jgi:hypothetical protein
VTDAIQPESFDEDSCYQDRLGFLARLLSASVDVRLTKGTEH